MKKKRREEETPQSSLGCGPEVQKGPLPVEADGSTGRQAPDCKDAKEVHQIGASSPAAPYGPTATEEIQGHNASHP